MCNRQAKMRFVSLCGVLVTTLGLQMIGPPVANAQQPGADLESIRPGQTITLPAAVGTDIDILGKGFDAQLRERDVNGTAHRIYQSAYSRSSDENRFDVEVDVIDNQTELGAYGQLLFLRLGTKQTERKRYAVLRAARIKKVVTLREDQPMLDTAAFVATRIIYGWAVYHVIEGDETTFSQNTALSLKTLGFGAGRVIKENRLHVQKKYIGLNPIEESDTESVVSDESVFEQRFHTTEQPVPIAVEYRALQAVPIQSISWASSRLRPGPYRLKSLTATVSSTKSDGRPWDVFQGPPDPIIQVFLDDKQVYECFHQDQFKVDCSSSRIVYLKEDSKLRVVAIDRDLSDNDPIGEAHLSHLLQRGVAYDDIEMESDSPQLEHVAIRLIPVQLDPELAEPAAPVVTTDSAKSMELPIPDALQAPQRELLPPLAAQPRVADPQPITPVAPPPPAMRPVSPPNSYPTGLQVQRISPGWGPPVRAGQRILVHYVVRSMSDGRTYDNTFMRRQPVAFRVGSGEVFRGLDEGVMAMAEGERRQLRVPPHLGYASIPGAPPTAVRDPLVVFVQLLRILPPSE